MLATETPKDELVCPGCGHSLTTTKTIGKSDTLTVTCPRCKAAAMLGGWRQRAEEAVVFDESDVSPAKGRPSVLATEVGGCLYQLMFVVFPGLVAFGGILAGLFDETGTVLLRSLLLLLAVAILEKLMAIEKKLDLIRD